MDETADRGGGPARPRANESGRHADAEPLGSGAECDGRPDANTDPHARRDPDSDPDTDGHARRDPDTNTNGHSGGGDPDTNANGHSGRGDPDTNADGHSRRADADTDPVDHPQRDADIDACAGNRHADPNTDRHADRDSDPDADSNADPDACRPRLRLVCQSKLLMEGL